MGKINTGQKFYYLAILAAGAGIAVSGFAIWLLPGVTDHNPDIAPGP